MRIRWFTVLPVLCVMFAATSCLAGPPSPPASSEDVMKMVQSHFSDGIYHFPKGIYNITSNVTLTNPVVFDNGAIFNISDGVIVMFQSSFSAGMENAFTGNGKVAGIKKLVPEWFGAIGDGVADDTLAIQKSLDCCEDKGIVLGSAGTGNVILLTKAYLVSSVIVKSSYATIQSENAWLIAKRDGNYPYLLKVTAPCCTITGNLNIEGNYNLGYDCIIHVNTRHFTSNNVVISRASLAWLFGDRKWATSGIPGNAELGDSENTIIGGSTIHCLRGVEAVGANTIIFFSGVAVFSYPWALPADDPRKAAWEAADHTLVRSIGSYIYFTGGELANFSNQVPLIEVQPIKCTQPQYFSAYGCVYVSNANIETGNIFAAANPHKIPTQDHKGGKVVWKRTGLILVSCAGYLTGNNAIINTDPLFTGKIIIKECNFYGIDRTAEIAKIGNPLAIIDIDASCVSNDGCPVVAKDAENSGAGGLANGLNAVVGGTRKFTHRMIFEAKETKQSIGADGAIVIYSKPVLTSDTGNFQSCYNAKTGEFTVPSGGLRNVCISARTYCVNGKVTDTTEMTILKNGKPIALDGSVGRSANISFTIDSLFPGDVITIRQCTFPEARVLSGDDLNCLQITASRY